MEKEETVDVLKRPVVVYLGCNKNWIQSDPYNVKYWEKKQ
jgi:hypothetical protein